MAAWSLLSELIFKTTSMFIDNSNLIKKIVFPKLALPSIVVGTALVNNLLLLLTVLVGFFLLGHGLSISVVWLALLVILTILTGTGIGLVLGVLNVFVRDIGQILPIAMQFAFWFTPIVYPSSAIPQAYHRFLVLNPFYSIVESYHSVLVLKISPRPELLFTSIMTSVLIVSFGLFLFKRASTEIVDAL
jgi:lipopolysaccharide transport system permease protein